MIWCGAEWAATRSAVKMWVVVALLAGGGRCRWLVGRADNDSRIPKEVEEEEACSEFWSSYLRVVQS